MGAIVDVMPNAALARTPGRDVLGAVRGVPSPLFGVLDTGPTGVRSRSQSSQSGVREGLGLRHWVFSATERHSALTLTG